MFADLLTVLSQRLPSQGSLAFEHPSSWQKRVTSFHQTFCIRRSEQCHFTATGHGTAEIRGSKVALSEKFGESWTKLKLNIAELAPSLGKEATQRRKIWQ